MTRIFYVEDEPFLAKIVKESLQTRGFDILHFDKGDQALVAFEQLKVDLCILDIMLPGQDGFEIAQHIRKLNSDIPIIFLTAKDQQEDVIKGFKLGANDYIRKPFSMEELILRIHNLLKMLGKSSQSEAIQIGHYSYFPDQLLVSFGAEKFPLSHKENQILNLLTTHSNVKLDRNKILMEVWGNDSFFNSRTLDVYISKLRTLFEKDERIRILTLRGVGYLFSVG